MLDTNGTTPNATDASPAAPTRAVRRRVTKRDRRDQAAANDLRSALRDAAPLLSARRVAA